MYVHIYVNHAIHNLFSASVQILLLSLLDATESYYEYRLQQYTHGKTSITTGKAAFIDGESLGFLCEPILATSRKPLPTPHGQGQML